VTDPAAVWTQQRHYEVLRQKQSSDWPLVCRRSLHLQGGRNAPNATNVKIVLGHVAPTPNNRRVRPPSRALDKRRCGNRGAERDRRGAAPRRRPPSADAKTRQGPPLTRGRRQTRRAVFRSGRWDWMKLLGNKNHGIPKGIARAPRCIAITCSRCKVWGRGISETDLRREFQTGMVEYLTCKTQGPRPRRGRKRRHGRPWLQTPRAC